MRGEGRWEGGGPQRLMYLECACELDLRCASGERGRIAGDESLGGEVSGRAWRTGVGVVGGGRFRGGASAGAARCGGAREGFAAELVDAAAGNAAAAGPEMISNTRGEDDEAAAGSELMMAASDGRIGSAEPTLKSTSAMDSGCLTGSRCAGSQRILAIFTHDGFSSSSAAGAGAGT